jgi:hypothetical protein
VTGLVVLVPVYIPLASIALNAVMVALPEGAVKPIVTDPLVSLTKDKLVGARGTVATFSAVDAVE